MSGSLCFAVPSSQCFPLPLSVWAGWTLLVLAKNWACLMVAMALLPLCMGHFPILPDSGAVGRQMCLQNSKKAVLIRKRVQEETQLKNNIELSLYQNSHMANLISMSSQTHYSKYSLINQYVSNELIHFIMFLNKMFLIDAAAPLKNICSGLPLTLVVVPTANE